MSEVEELKIFLDQRLQTLTEAVKQLDTVGNDSARMVYQNNIEFSLRIFIDSEFPYIVKTLNLEDSYIIFCDENGKKVNAEDINIYTLYGIRYEIKPIDKSKDRVSYVYDLDYFEMMQGLLEGKSYRAKDFYRGCYITLDRDTGSLVLKDTNEYQNDSESTIRDLSLRTLSRYKYREVRVFTPKHLTD